MDDICDNFDTETGSKGHVDLVDYLSAVDWLHNACLYLSKQFSSVMDKTEARAHFDSHASLCRLEQTVLNEAEANFSDITSLFHTFQHYPQHHHNGAPPR